MRAWRSHRPGGPSELTLDEIPTPSPGSGQLLVRVQAAGINFPDTLTIRDRYQVRRPRPFVPGSELCGVVVAVGDAVSDFDIGDIVVAVVGWGALAEFVICDAESVICVDGDVSREEAAALMFTYATAHFALTACAQLRTGETLVVLGAAGGVGSAAVQLGRAVGAHVVAAASSSEKIELALSQGANAGVIYPKEFTNIDVRRRFTRELQEAAPTGIDAVLDPVGGDYAEMAMRALAYRGRYLVVGFAAGIPVVPLNVALIKSLQVIGVDWHTFGLKCPEGKKKSCLSVVDYWRAGKIAPRISARFDFADAPAAIAHLENRSTSGKIVVRFETAENN